MLKILALSSFLFIFSDVALSKPDYIFNYQVNGWLKLHKIPVTWIEAYLKCHNEGAVLASPVDELMVNSLLGVMTEFNVEVSIHIGVHSRFSEGDFCSIDGVRLSDMPIMWGGKEKGAETGDCLTMNMAGRAYYMSTSPCQHRHPYICYKTYGNNTKLNECGTFDSGYQLNQLTGSCYKLHENVHTWGRAYSICLAEGGHLVILNNELEAGIIKDMFPHRDSSEPLDGMHIGLRDWNDDRTWFTIHGEGVDTVYNKWAVGQPDNYAGGQRCAILLPMGTMDDNSCYARFMFVCEKEPNYTRFGPASFIEILN